MCRKKSSLRQRAFLSEVPLVKVLIDHDLLVNLGGFDSFVLSQELLLRWVLYGNFWSMFISDSLRHVDEKRVRLLDNVRLLLALLDLVLTLILGRRDHAVDGGVVEIHKRLALGQRFLWLLVRVLL